MAKTEIDAVSAHGAAALGGRLRRLSERIDREAQALYAELGVSFEQRWFPVFDCLRAEGPLSVTDLAARLGVSHVSISVIRTGLEDAGLVGSKKDDRDGRRRVLFLTSQGQSLARRLAPFFEALNRAAIDLNNEVGNAIAVVSRLEHALEERSLSHRVKTLWDGSDCQGNS